MTVTRRTFLAGTLAASATPLAEATPVPRKDLLTLGLTALGRACDRPGWFQGHWGAAILATHYLLEETTPPEPLRAAILGQADALMAAYPAFFRPLDEKPTGAGSSAEISRALEEPIMRLRASGHAVIFATLALRALKDAPHRATPGLIKGIVTLTRRIGKLRPVPDHDYNRGNPLPPITDEATLAEATFDCLLRYENVRFAPAGGDGLKRPNFTHQITYTEALIQLGRSGYGDLAKQGHAPHAVYLNTAPPATTPREAKPHPDASLEKLLTADFWNSEARRRNWKAPFHVQKNRMGHWVVGHLFKLLYSYIRVRELVKDPDKIRRVDGIVLQRYVDPLASGG